MRLRVERRRGAEQCWFSLARLSRVAPALPLAVFSQKRCQAFETPSLPTKRSALDGAYRQTRRPSMRWTTTWLAAQQRDEAWRAQPPPPLPQPLPLPRLQAQPLGPASVCACADGAAPATSAARMIDVSSTVQLPPTHRLRLSCAASTRVAHQPARQPPLRWPLHVAQSAQSTGGCIPAPARSQPQSPTRQQLDGTSPQGCHPPAKQALAPLLGSIIAEADAEMACGASQRQAAFLQFRQLRTQRTAAATLIQAHVRQAQSQLLLKQAVPAGFTLAAACMNRRLNCCPHTLLQGYTGTTGAALPASREGPAVATVAAHAAAVASDRCCPQQAAAPRPAGQPASA